MDSFIAELLGDVPLPNGRCLRQMQGNHSPVRWEARINDAYRVVFEIDEDGQATLRNLGDHSIYN